jgi:NAD(P)-dependent dehydrogenase (short-subunit alcohol dehydrogenase family)
MIGTSTPRRAALTPGWGIGLGIARRFARDGATVVVAEVNETTGTAAAAALTDEPGACARFVATDVTDREAVDAMVDTPIGAYGRVDVLVSNARGGASMVRLVPRRRRREVPDRQHVVRRRRRAQQRRAVGPRPARLRVGRRTTGTT